jgi:hypothetical protein
VAPSKPTAAPAPAPATSAAITDDSVFGDDRSILKKRTTSHRDLIHEKFPADLLCPLDSIDPVVIEHFWFRMNNHLFGGHPNIRKLIAGDLIPPLLTYEPYMFYKKAEAAPGEYVFDYNTAEVDLRKMRENGKEKLAQECEAVLDNPPALDGFRPCNNTVFYALLKSVKSSCSYILRDINRGDGIGLHNKMWNNMMGDASNSKKLLAMNFSKTLADIRYKFERHGVSKYFSEIHKYLSKLRTLGAQKQDWERGFLRHL